MNENHVHIAPKQPKRRYIYLVTYTAMYVFPSLSVSFSCSSLLYIFCVGKINEMNIRIHNERCATNKNTNVGMYVRYLYDIVIDMHFLFRTPFVAFVSIRIIFGHIIMLYFEMKLVYYVCTIGTLYIYDE